MIGEVDAVYDRSVLASNFGLFQMQPVYLHLENLGFKEFERERGDYILFYCDTS